MLRVPKSLAALASAALLVAAPIALADEASGNGQDPPGVTSTSGTSALLTDATLIDLATDAANLLLQVSLL